MTSSAKSSTACGNYLRITSYERNGYGEERRSRNQGKLEAPGRGQATLGRRKEDDTVDTQGCRPFLEISRSTAGESPLEGKDITAHFRPPLYCSQAGWWQGGEMRLWARVWRLPS